MTRIALVFVSAVFACLVLTSPARATVVYDQPHDAGSALHKSAWYPPDGLDSDIRCWDDFTLATNVAVTEVHWRGGYEFHPSGTGRSPVFDFEVSIYRSIPAGTQPDLGPGGRLVQYFVGGNANETPAGSFGGMTLFDYAYTLPSPFPATAGTRYWVYVVASQGAVPPSYAPDWGFARGTGGDAHHFRHLETGMYQSITDDLAFSLWASDGPTVTITASALPASAGTVSGAGAYPSGSLVSLTASAQPGWGFVRWSEGGTTVSTQPTYAFTASIDRTLVANFDTTYAVVTAPSPHYGGTTTGDGTYLDGSTVTVTATADPGFVFASWSDGATTPVHSFPATSDVWLTAFFDSAPDAVTFDFDAGPVSISLPLDQTVSGLTAHFAGGYSIQPFGTLGIAPMGMGGNYLYPSSVFLSDLEIGFSEPLVAFSILLAPVEIACDTSARLRVTAYLGAVLVATNTATSPVPGTYPPVTLMIAPASTFDRVVVHWDAPGLACGDYAPIFLADVVTVTRANPPVGMGDHHGSGMPMLGAPMPNPFHTETSIRCEMLVGGDMRLSICDVRGRHVRSLASGVRAAGSHSFRWDGCDDAGRAVAAGVYVVRLDTSGGSARRTIVRLE